jgi:hypothetical protein
MNDDAQEGQERSSRGLLGVWLSWVGSILAVYVLGVGPVAMLIDKKVIGPNTPTYKFLKGLYSPVGWAYTDTLLRRPLGMYLHLWTPNGFDAKGNIKTIP